MTHQELVDHAIRYVSDAIDDLKSIDTHEESPDDVASQIYRTTEDLASLLSTLEEGE